MISIRALIWAGVAGVGGFGLGPHPHGGFGFGPLGGFGLVPHPHGGFGLLPLELDDPEFAEDDEPDKLKRKF